MAKYPGTLESNNPNEFGIVYASEVSGHKTVQTFDDLNTIPNAILSKSKVNLNNDAIGQIWYVVDTQKYYQLVNWDPREWVSFQAGATKEDIIELQAEIQNNIKSIKDNEKEITDIKSDLDTIINWYEG